MFSVLWVVFFIAWYIGLDLTGRKLLWRDSVKHSFLQSHLKRINLCHIKLCLEEFGYFEPSFTSSPFWECTQVAKIKHRLNRKSNDPSLETSINSDASRISQLLDQLYSLSFVVRSTLYLIWHPSVMSCLLFATFERKQTTARTPALESLTMFEDIKINSLLCFSKFCSQKNTLEAMPVIN